MLNSEALSMHLHLYYKGPSTLLLEKISKAWGGKVYISLVSENENNKDIVSIAKSLFSEVVVVENENSGNDQYGFYKSLQQNNDDTDWIFYAHDKHESKIDWMNALIDPLIAHSDTINYLIRQDNIGLIAAKSNKYTCIQISEEQLNSLGDICPQEERIKIIQSKQTLVWLRELQRSLARQNKLSQIHDPNALVFIAGNIFIIRRSVLHKCHNCLHENFFGKHYRQDGDIGHGLERFYFYAPLCLNFNVQLVGEETND
jgi:lipopolysaccharide biosynthesis protein